MLAGADGRTEPQGSKAPQTSGSMRVGGGGDLGAHA